MDTNNIKNLLDSTAGEHLKEYLLIKLVELKDIDSLDLGLNPRHNAIELKAQKKAYDKLKEIYSTIMTMSGTVTHKDLRDNYY